MKRASAFVLGVSLFAAAPALAQLPQAASDVPVYPGAVSVEHDGIYFETVGGQDYSNPIQVLDQGRLTWQVDAPTEDVFRWYRERIPTRERPVDDPDWAPMAGDEFPASHVISPHDLQREGDGEVMSGAQIRAGLVRAGRRPLTRDVYVQNAEFIWTLPGTAAGEHTDFYLQLIDEGVFYATEGHRTTIDLQWTRYLEGDAAADYAERAEDERDEQVYSERMAEMASAPTEADLGVASYRGARFHRDLSVGMSSSDDERMYVFFSDDEPGVVRAFYERETGVTARDLGSGSFMIAIRGSGLMPEHGVLVGPTTGTPYESFGRTMFAVRRVLDE